MTEVDLYRALWFKKNQFKKLVQGIKTSDQEKFVTTLRPFAEKYSWFAEMVPWVKTENGREEVALGKLLAKSECEAAKQKYAGWLNGADIKPEGMAVEMEKVADVGRCFRKNGVEARVAALRDFATILESKFGFLGKSAIAVEVAKAYWSADKYTEARSVLADIFAEALAQSKLDDVGAAQHLLAQIYENEHRLEDAIINFEFYIGRYKDTTLTFDALRSLVLLYAEKQEWVKAAEAAQRMVAIQDSQPEEKREVSKAGFGLFWSGRAWLALGEKELASSAWKRLKTKYYSTYYGALGHFLLEASLNQVFDVEMVNDKEFTENEFVYSPFDESDQLRVKAISVFLRAGLSKEADCEIDELAAQKNPSKDYARALLYQASGAWLKSVKVFDELPRTFRNNLPRGSERVLFPIRYKETIENFALRLNMDPDFVIGLIRQESLFDSQAMSPVGAIGLMQLMEATAQMEVKRMDSNYFEENTTKSSLLQVASSNMRLFETETNLMIGIHHVNTLMKKYGSPVFTLSAYNAGPGAMLKWKDKFDSSDLLLFVEKIPYKETNSYVKLILRNYFYYKKWYRESTLSMPHLEAVASPLVKIPMSVPKEEAKDKGAVSL
jgi:soluble lytic murein transglycosylase-like protein